MSNRLLWFLMFLAVVAVFALGGLFMAYPGLQ